MRADADQALQLFASPQATFGSRLAAADVAVILERIRAWRNELDHFIEKYGDPRDERA
jgi:hypothetical protein